MVPFAGTFYKGSDLSRCVRRVVPIRRLLKNSALDPDDAQRVTKAFEQALRAIGVENRNDPLSELVAKKVFQARQAGLKDPTQICAHAVNEFRHGMTGPL